MNERDAFIAAICENPADDVARLVFADWLDEHGEERRACYIRENIFSERSGHAFLGGHDSLGWYPGTHEVGDKATFHISRGFVSRIELPCATFIQHAEELFRAHPVTIIFLTDDNLKPWNYGYVRAGGSRRRRPAAIIGRSGWNPRPDGQAEVPTEIFDYFVGFEGWNWCHFKNDDEAIAARSHACVAFGRKKAKLPPLPVTAPAV